MGVSIRPPAPLTPERISRIQFALRLVADGCDGAVAADGAGFNREDKDWGRRLAYRDRWNEEQAKEGLRLCRNTDGSSPPISREELGLG